VELSTYLLRQIINAEDESCAVGALSGLDFFAAPANSAPPLADDDDVVDDMGPDVEVAIEDFVEGATSATSGWAVSWLAPTLFFFAMVSLLAPRDVEGDDRQFVAKTKKSN